jgi:hypothetical protein
MLSARAGSLLGLGRRPGETGPMRRRPSLPLRAPSCIRGRTSASAAAVDRDEAPSPSPPSLAALLAPRLPPLLPAAILWDADNVRPSGGDPQARVIAVRRRLVDLALQLSDAGCRVVQATAYGNAATLGDEGGSARCDGFPSGCRARLIVTNTRKRQSADMALLSDLAAFVSQQQEERQQKQRPPAQPGAGAVAGSKAAPSCLVLLIADDAGYGVTCAWAAAAPRSAVVVACGASAGRRARYAPPSSPAEPWRFHPLARSGAALVVPWASGGDGGGGGPDVAAAWINPEGLLA